MSEHGQPRRKVCFVLPSLAGGGAERAAVQVLNALDGDALGSVDVSVRAQRAVSRGPVAARFSSWRRTTASRLGRWRALRRFVRRSRPDVIVAFLSYLSVLDRRLARPA